MNIDNNRLRKTTTISQKKNRLPLLLANKSHVTASRLCTASEAMYSNFKMIHPCSVLDNKNHTSFSGAQRFIYSVLSQQNVSAEGAMMMMMMMMMMAHWAGTCR
jgi:uncharacterized radical SAM superfamily Fe-S cluster-containing enzyme